MQENDGWVLGYEKVVDISTVVFLWGIFCV